MSVVAWVVARAGRAEQVGVAEAAMAQEAAAARARAKLGQEAAAARAQETRAVAVAEAVVAVVKAMEAGVAQEPLGLVAAVGRAQAAPAAEAEAGMAPESAWGPAWAKRTAYCSKRPPPTLEGQVRNSLPSREYLRSHAKICDSVIPHADLKTPPSPREREREREREIPRSR